MNLRTRASAVREYLTGSLWALPTVAVLAAVVGGSVLSGVSIESTSRLDAIVFGGGPGGARSVLEVVAGSVITVVSVTFSLTVVALVMAASQYSPRVLRTFLRDRGNQLVLSTFLATFAYSVVVLRTIRGEDDAQQPFVPSLAVTVAVVLALASLAALVYFIHHLTQSIRVESIASGVARETLTAIDHNHPEGEGDLEDRPLPDPPAGAVALRATASGYLQTVEHLVLAERLAEHAVVARLRHMPGEFVTTGTVVAWAWPSSGDHGPDAAALQLAVNAALQLGDERTMQQDVTFGLRQLADIAIKALSPSVNDPTTATNICGHLSVLLVTLARRPLGPRLHRDDDGAARLAVPRPTFADCVRLSCEQIADYGAGDPVLVHALLRVLQDVGLSAPTPTRRQAVVDEVDRTLAHAEQQLTLAADKATVRGAAAGLGGALTGDRGADATTTP